MLNVVATLRQRLDNVRERRCHNVRNLRRYNSHFRPCHNVTQRRCDNVVTTSLCQLGMDTSELWIERAHQVGEKKRGQERQIVVQFNSYKNKLDILRNCKKLKDTNFSVFEDFSKEITSITKEKWKEVLKN